MASLWRTGLALAVQFGRLLKAVSPNSNHLEIRAPQRVMVWVLRGPELWEGFMRRREIIAAMAVGAATTPCAANTQLCMRIPPRSLPAPIDEAIE